MLLIIEKVIILKTVSVFAEIPDRTLADLAALTTEVNLSAGDRLFTEGDLGDSMYIINQGRVRVHVGQRLLNYLGERDIFGEMALFDPEPRSASVTAETDTHLLRLDQEAVYELMDQYSDVSRGIIQVLSRHLRERVRDLDRLTRG